MINHILSAQELDLLQAALVERPQAAYTGWQSWLASTPIDQAPHSQLRILPAVYANLSRLGFAGDLPEKIKGKARATFTQNSILLNAALPAIQLLKDAQIPVMLCKGVDLCARFNSWSNRSMGDIDLYIPPGTLSQACTILQTAGWKPQYGMTWDSLIWRSSLKRESWNLRKQHGDLDLHWALAPGQLSQSLFSQLWETSQELSLKGVLVQMPTPEFALLLILQHAFVFGTRNDVLQAIIDIAKLKANINHTSMQALLKSLSLKNVYDQVINVIDHIQQDKTLLAKEDCKPKNTFSIEGNLSIVTSQKPENQLVRFPKLYHAWQALGFNSSIERLLLQLLGPISKPLAGSTYSSLSWDVRECQILDTIGGPGWTWPEPEHTCFWSDRADARLLLPLPKQDEYLLIINLGEHWKGRPNYEVTVYANGHALGDLPLDYHCQAVYWISRYMLYGNWVEISFRPKHFLKEMKARPTRVCVPLRQMRLIAQQEAGDYFQKVPNPNWLMRSILNQEEPYYSKYQNIRSKLMLSPECISPALPPHFDPLYYILLNPDLLDAQVDPYEHFIHHGMNEGRAWK